MNKLILLILVTLLPQSLLSAAESAPPVPDPLVRGFVSPPDSARPQTWWHWMNGNITKAGITADLEAMKQIGLGGATIVNVDCGIPAGPVIPGTGSSLSFGIQTNGTYTISAYRKATYLSNVMNGSAIITLSTVTPTLSGK